MTLYSARSTLRLVVSLCSGAFLLSLSHPAAAYAWMIRHDYTGCNACHADPSGGGLLTAYGRALGADEMTTKWGFGGEGSSPPAETKPPAEEFESVAPPPPPPPPPPADDEDVVKPPPKKPGKTVPPAKGDKKKPPKKGEKSKTTPKSDEEDEDTPVARPKKAAPPPPAPVEKKPEETKASAPTALSGSNEGGFLWGLVSLPDNLLLGGDFRGAEVKLSKSTPWKFYMMQADLEGQIAYDRLRVNASIGYDGTNLARLADITTSQTNNLVSRNHWVGIDLGEEKEWLIRAGHMNVPFGIRSIEHELWIRSTTVTDINQDQQDGVSVALNTTNIRAEVMGVIGNLQVAPAIYRERGYVGYFEYAPTTRLAIGVDSMILHADQDYFLGGKAYRQAHGLFARYSPIPMVYTSLEAAYVYNSVQNVSSAGGYIGTLQVDIEPLKGLHIEGTMEMSNMPGGPSFKHLSQPGFDYWGSLSWFFLPHTDVRLDIARSELPPSSPVPSATTMVAQLHVYL